MAIEWVATAQGNVTTGARRAALPVRRPAGHFRVAPTPGRLADGSPVSSVVVRAAVAPRDGIDVRRPGGTHGALLSRSGTHSGGNSRHGARAEQGLRVMVSSKFCNGQVAGENRTGRTGIQGVQNIKRQANVTDSDACIGRGAHSRVKFTFSHKRSSQRLCTSKSLFCGTRAAIDIRGLTNILLRVFPAQ